MGSVGSRGVRNSNLIPIENDKNWFYHPRENSQLYKNPIKYAGNELTRDIVDSYYGWNHELDYEKTETVDLRKLKSTQAFVTQQGLENATGEDKEIFAVRYDDGNLYLMDGNHRIARDLLNGKTHRNILVKTLKPKNKVEKE